MKVNLQIRKMEQTISDIEEQYLLDSSVRPETYRKVITEKNIQLSELNGKREALTTGAHDYMARLDNAMAKVSDLRSLYDSMTLATKQNFIRQVFGWKLIYHQGAYRTTFLHPVFHVKVATIKNLPLILERETAANGEKFKVVTPLGLEPRTY